MDKRKQDYGGVLYIHAIPTIRSSAVIAAAVRVNTIGSIITLFTWIDSERGKYIACRQREAWNVSDEQIEKQTQSKSKCVLYIHAIATDWNRTIVTAPVRVNTIGSVITLFTKLRIHSGRKRHSAIGKHGM